jgi:DNA-directed RNA polymerase subunit M/transcription elongation factor TFIIS
LVQSWRLFVFFSDFFKKGGIFVEPSPPVTEPKNVECPNCGANLSYKPGTTSLVCEHCGSTFEIKEEAPLQQAQKENDLLTALSNNWQDAQQQGVAYVVKCPACGAETALEKNMFSSECTFCGTPITVTPNTKAIANPQGVLPFKLEKQAASTQFNNWLRRLWFAPNDLKKYATSDRLNGIYLPFWTFDSNTQSNYQGERGEHYYVTERRVINGKEENVRVMKTRWYPVSGWVQRAFDDILVTASRALPEKYLNQLEPWDLPNLVPFDNRYLSGFKAEVSQVDIKAGFEEAKQVMAAVIRQDVQRDIGGDEQRVHAVQTQFSLMTYKYILLPVWLSIYRYGNKIYRFVVNARTGEVHGERPYSAIKIALAILLALVILGILIYFLGQH